MDPATRIMIRGMLYSDSMMMVISLGANPVSGGNPARENRSIIIMNWVGADILLTLLICFEDIMLYLLNVINIGITREQYTVK